MPSIENAPMIDKPQRCGDATPTRRDAQASGPSRRRRRTLGALAVLVVTLALAGCADDDDGTASNDEQPSGTSRGPALDVEERTAESEGVEMEVTSAGEGGRTWVTALDEDLFVAVVDEGDGDGADRQVLAFLCDGDTVAEWLTAEEAADEVTLTGDATIMQVALADDEATGTVTVDGGEPLHFTAEPATGDAGLYQGATVEGDTRHTGAWIVLDDGRQRGWWWRAEGHEEEEELQM